MVATWAVRCINRRSPVSVCKRGMEYSASMRRCDTGLAGECLVYTGSLLLVARLCGMQHTHVRTGLSMHVHAACRRRSVSAAWTSCPSRARLSQTASRYVLSD